MRHLLLATLVCCTTAFAQPPAPAQLAEAVLGELPGVAAVGVLRSGKMEVAVRRRERLGQPLQAATGPEPIFEIGSVSKVFTGLLVAQRVERGQLRLDDTVGRLLQGRVSFRYEGVGQLQVGQLLTHRSCLPRWPQSFSAASALEEASALTPAQAWAGLGTTVLGRAPPCETRYSNVGYAVLGETLALRAQRSWEALVLQDIVQPLGLRDTRQHLSAAQQARLAPPWRGTQRSQPWDAGVFAAAGGLRSTATDLLVFSQALLQGRRGPLGPAADRLVGDLAPFGEQGARIAYGVLLPQGPGRTWLHDGLTRAYNTEWIVWPDRREAVVILASNSAAPTAKIRRDLIAGTWAGSVQEVVYTRGEFRGTFKRDGRLYVQLKIAPGQKLPFSTLSYRVPDAALVAGFARNALVEFRAERIDGENTLTAIRLPPARP